MKAYFIEKYTLLTCGVLIFSFVFLYFGGVFYSSAFSPGDRKIPIYSVETNKKYIAITFNTAWGDDDIDSILNTLKEAECKSTFFFTGEFTGKHPEAVMKIYKAGHQVANHSNCHEHFSSLREYEMRQSITACDEKIKKLTGRECTLFRAPYGEYDTRLVSLCTLMGKHIIQWSIDSIDYENPPYEEMEKRILSKIKNGDIILFHTGTEKTREYLPKILKKLSQKGYKYKTVGNLIHKGNYRVDFSGRQFKK